MKTFILLCGLPGVGKSTWAENYKKTHKNVYIVASDELRMEVGGAYQNFDHEAEIWKLFFDRIIEYKDKAEDVTVIADSTNIENRFRLYYGQNVTGYDKKILVVLKKNVDIVKKQNVDREPGRIVPDEVIDRMNAKFEEPTDEVLALYDEYVVEN